MSKQFRELSKKDVWENEQDILKEWKKEDILNETIENRKGKENWVFYDGPATANGKPGIHHMVAKFLKDAFCKYKTMQGKRVLRKIGWDTHGLPVEVQVEKELGFNGKKDIEKFGIEAFNKKCREAVWENEEAFTELTDQMGQFIDTKNRYPAADDVEALKTIIDEAKAITGLNEEAAAALNVAITQAQSELDYPYLTKQDVVLDVADLQSAIDVAKATLGGNSQGINGNVTGIDEAQTSAIRVEALNHRITVYGAQNVRIFNAAGQRQAANTILPSGAYIVKADGKVVKVVL